MSQQQSQPKKETIKQLDTLFEPLNEEQADKVSGGRRRGHGRSK